MTDSVRIVVDGRAFSPDFKGRISAVPAPPSNLIGLHAWNPAKVPTWFNAQTLDIRTYGATPDQHDDAPAINNALRESAIQKKPVFIPRGRFNVRQTIEVPAGASIIGASYTNSIVYADERWKRTHPVKTAVAIGNGQAAGSC